MTRDESSKLEALRAATDLDALGAVVDVLRRRACGEHHARLLERLIADLRAAFAAPEPDDGTTCPNHPPPRRTIPADVHATLSILLEREMLAAKGRPSPMPSALLVDDLVDAENWIVAFDPEES